MPAYYNEIDPYAAQWLRNLIDAGHIAHGVVDERSIEDVRPSDLAGFTQCHFFAGVGVWSLALRRAGWSDDIPVWTGSCPCQPFSSAGAGAGFEDPRHLWPTFAWLIKQCKPPIIFGEQVASKGAEPWVDLVHADVEAMEYAFGAIPFPSAGVGAPHIRDRLFWVADSKGHRRKRAGKLDESTRRYGAAHLRQFSRMEHSGLDNDAGQVEATSYRQSQTNRSANLFGRSSIPLVGLGDSYSESAGRYGRAAHAAQDKHGSINSKCDGPGHAGGALSTQRSTGPVNGLWSDADWLLCRDGKWRPVEPGTFPLAHGATSRVGRLRAYGNAINAEAATQFIAAFLDTQPT